MGKKPYSAKAKREQLRQKRLASTSTPPTTTPSSQAAHPAVPASNTSTPAVAASAANRRPRSRAPKRSAAQRYRLQLGDVDSTCSEQRSLAHETLSTLPSYEVSVSDIRPYPDVRFTMPRRPSWRYDDSLATLDKRENAALNSWIKQVDSPDTHSAFFEHNLETWRQLWRVIERSDVIVIVADIRFPALHFIPDLYHYVSDELGKGLVLALNKCDLVPAHLLNAWTRYFRDTYPDLAIAKFSSFPDAKLAPSEDNSEMLSKRERRMARSKLSAWGADQLLAAIDSLNLDPKKRAYLEEWRVQVGAEASSDDEQASLGTKFYLDDQGSYDPQSRRNTTPLAPGDEILMQKQKKKRRRAKAKFLGREPRLDAESDKDETDFHDVGSQTSNVKLELEDDETRENMLTIGVVGHPNAGKSSLINGIFGKKVMSTSRTPGHTKHLQTMFLTDSLRLCDCPGLVFPGLVPRELQILAGMFPISQVREPYAAVKYLAERVPLVELLNLESEVARLEEFTEENGYIRSGWTAWKICEAWAMKRGFRTAKAARLDVFRAANSILRLALDGRIVLATVPRGYSRRDSDGQCFGDSVINVSKNGGEVASAMKWTDERGKFEKGRADAKCSEEQSEDSERDDRIESSEESDDDIGSQPKLGNAFYLLADE